jgi:hypothetical protein
VRCALEEIDSLAFGRNVLRLEEPKAQADFRGFEKEYLAAWTPFYVHVKIPAEEPALIHYFEDQGFRFVEFQLRMTKRLPRRKYDLSFFEGAIAAEEAGPTEDIEPILQLADDIFENDRISRDPRLGRAPARRRYRLYIEKSWRAADEHLLKFYDPRSRELTGFHTHKLTDGATMLHFLGGLARKHWNSGLIFGHELMMYNRWIDLGVRKMVTHISMSNYRTLESGYKAHDFKAEQAFAVLRKLYPENAAAPDRASLGADDERPNLEQ